MEFTIAREELLQGLYLTQGIVERRTTIPILQNALIETTADGITVAATDQEIGVRRHCAAKVKKKGALTTAARKLYEISRELPAGDISVKVLDNNWIEVSAGKSRFKMVGLDPKEFPAMPEVPKDAEKYAASIPSATFREMVERSIFAVSTDDTRVNLSGIYLERSEKDRVRLVATDGHRLAMITRQVDGIAPAAGVLLPRKGVQEILKVIESGDGPLVFAVHSGVVYVRRDPVQLSMRLLEGEFPDYRQVIPADSPRKASVASSTLLAALRRVSLVSSERTCGVRLQIEASRMEVSSINPDVGEANEEIEVEADAKPLTVGFNARYIMDVLQVLPPDSRVEMAFNDEVSPAVLRSEAEPDYCCVVMPMRL
ncbi:MAG TPA: DNA polymerase III subunit beta [Candidatus Binatia bacterium]|nr:DNA polymerase III subunit beta [Candidatus Binatia bacterium]